MCPLLPFYGEPQDLASVVMSSHTYATFQRTSTSILTFAGDVLPVRPAAGARQGDQLYPLRFNLVLDEWLRHLTSAIAFESGHLRIDAMAFADVVVVLASTPVGLQDLLTGRARLLKPRGLLINAEKWFTVSIIKSTENKMQMDTTS